MKSILILLAATLSYSTLFAQETISVDSLKAIYERETIYLDGSNRTKYFKNNQKKRIGVIGDNLAKEFKGYPAAEEEMKIFKRKSINGLILSFAGVAGYFVSMVLFVQGEEEAGLGVMAGSVAATLVGAQQGVSSMKHFHKAIWLYNRDVLLKGVK